MKKKKSGAKNSIRAQMALVFIVVLLATTALSLLINTVFLENFYISKKSGDLERLCERIDLISAEHGSSSKELEEECDRLADNFNMSIIVADSSFNVLYSSEFRADLLVSRLVWHMLSNDDEKAPAGDEDMMEQMPPSKVLKQTDSYIISTTNDRMLNSDYIELWGTLDNGDVIFIRTALESIRENASLSNTFFLRITIFMALIGTLVIWLLTKRVTEPILRISEVADRVAHMDFDARYEGNTGNEVDELGEHINGMSDNLKKAMSELKTANNELRRDIEKKEKMESMRSEFISNVSHELKTPIALIRGYAEGLKDNIDSDEESRQFYCDVIIDESERMNTLVKNLMTLNQLEFGAEEITLERFDITELIKNCIASSDIMLKQFGVSAGFDMNDPVFVWGDEFRVEEVFSNLFSNAVHYAGGDKQINVTIKKNGHKVRISIFNTGDPIPEEAKEHIWDKFYKVDKARSREVGGSGVGLSIVKAIMEALNNSYGMINYENGVEFYFELDSAENEKVEI